MNAKVTDKTAEGKQQTAPIERDPHNPPQGKSNKDTSPNVKTRHPMHECQRRPSIRATKHEQEQDKNRKAIILRTRHQNKNKNLEARTRHE
jgi:hypothetical protein